MELLEIALRNPELFGKTLGELMSRAARGRADRGAAHGAPQRAGVSRTSSSPRTTSCSSSAPPRRRSSRRSKSLGEAAPGRLDQGPPRPRLPARVRVAAGRGGPNARRSRPAGREGVGRRPGSPRRRRPPAAAGPRARVRRPRRPARQSRRLPGAAQVLRRLDQGHRRVQLHLHRPGHGARLPARRDPASRCPASASSRWGCRAC